MKTKLSLSQKYSNAVITNSGISKNLIEAKSRLISCNCYKCNLMSWKTLASNKEKWAWPSSCHDNEAMRRTPLISSFNILLRHYNCKSCPNQVLGLSSRVKLIIQQSSYSISPLIAVPSSIFWENYQNLLWLGYHGNATTRFQNSKLHTSSRLERLKKLPT